MHLHVCGGKEFEVVVKRSGKVIMSDNNGTTHPILTDESDSYELEFVKCLNCNELITSVEAHIVEAVNCSECGEFAIKTQMSDDGKCKTCVTPPRPDLIGLSEKDYIRRILDLEKRLSRYGGQDINMPDMKI